MESITTKQELEYNFDPLEVRQLVDWSRCHTGLPFLARAEGFVLRCNPCKTFTLIDRPWGTKLTAEIDLAAFRMHWNNDKKKKNWKRKQLICSSGSTGIQMSWMKSLNTGCWGFPPHAEGTSLILPSPDLIDLFKAGGMADLKTQPSLAVLFNNSRGDLHDKFAGCEVLSESFTVFEYNFL